LEKKKSHSCVHFEFVLKQAQFPKTCF